MENQKIAWDIEYKRNKDKWNMETQTLPSLLKDKKILELGVENGKTLKSIIRQKPKKIVAVDFSKQAIKRCIKLFQSEKIRFVNVDAKDLPFKDEEFDVVICYYILNNLYEDERKQAVDEIYRVLKKKGKVIFEDFGEGDFREIGKAMKEEHTIMKKNGIMCHFFNIKELNSLFNGFKLKEFNKRTFFPIKNKPSLRRKIISGLIRK